MEPLKIGDRVSYFYRIGNSGATIEDIVRSPYAPHCAISAIVTLDRNGRTANMPMWTLEREVTA